MLPHACIGHISQMYKLGLTGSAQRDNSWIKWMERERGVYLLDVNVCFSVQGVSIVKSS